MSLIDGSYFNLDINTPDNEYQNIQEFIDRYEPEILKQLLGLELYRLVIEETPTEQRILDLRDGVDYDVDGVTYHWNGLINDDQISLIAYYVYYYYVRFNMSENSTIGQVKVKPENGSVANPSLTVQDAWTRLEQLYGSAYYPTAYESAYGFLNYFKDIFPEWIFQEIGSVNAFDL